MSFAVELSDCYSHLPDAGARAMLLVGLHGSTLALLKLVIAMQSLQDIACSRSITRQ